jgi:hypothetical protein
MEAISDRKGRYGRVRFALANMMGTAISGNDQVIHITSDKGFCEFGYTGMVTIRILTMIFKSLIPDWPIILDFRASKDISK